MIRSGALRRWSLRFPDLHDLPDSAPAPMLVSVTDEIPVVIPHWNAPDWCLDTVTSFIEQAGVECAVTVIDNSAAVGSRLVLPDDVEVVAPTRNLGYAGAVNLELSRWLDEDLGDTFIAACHDCVLRPWAVRALLSALAAEPRAGIVGLGGATHQPHSTVRLAPRVWVSGTCLAIRRSCARQIGFLDEQLGTYDEDLDYCLRAWDAGWLVFSVDAAAATTHGSAAHDRTERIARNHVVLAQKRRGVRGAAVELVLQYRHGVAALLASARRGNDADRGRAGGGWQRLRGATLGMVSVATSVLRSGGSSPP